MTITSKPRPLFDRTVGFALIATIVLETAGAMHWAGRLTQRVQQVEIKARPHRPDQSAPRPASKSRWDAAQGSLPAHRGRPGRHGSPPRRPR